MKFLKWYCFVYSWRLVVVAVIKFICLIYVAANRGGLGSKGLCAIQKFPKRIPKGFFATFCMFMGPWHMSYCHYGLSTPDCKHNFHYIESKFNFQVHQQFTKFYSSNQISLGSFQGWAYSNQELFFQEYYFFTSFSKEQLYTVRIFVSNRHTAAVRVILTRLRGIEK
jgi:hypothetical protein